MTPEEAYLKFKAITLHFRGDSYDYHKYHGKVKAAPFDRDKNIFLFKKLSTHPDLELFVAYSCYISPKYVGIKDIITSSYLTKEFKSFSDDMNNCLDILSKDISGYNIRDLISTRAGKYPLLMEMFLTNEISLITFLILYNHYHLADKWLDIVDDIGIMTDSLRGVSKFNGFFKDKFFVMDYEPILDVIRKHP